jgi:hypothetical protein
MKIIKRVVTLFALGGFAWILLSGCTGESDAHTFEKVSSTGRVIVVGEVLDSQFKDLKQYATAELPGASDAIYGFMRSGSDAFDYEVRFYESHEHAVELGTSYAEEGAGPNAAISKDDARFKEGVTDRRLAYGADRGAAGPKYGAYMIYENLVILCQGANADQGMERCEFFVTELGAK